MDEQINSNENAECKKNFGNFSFSVNDVFLHFHSTEYSEIDFHSVIITKAQHNLSQSCLENGFYNAALHLQELIVQFIV